jgi:hypothetical protein
MHPTDAVGNALEDIGRLLRLAFSSRCLRMPISTPPVIDGNVTVGIERSTRFA